MPTFDVVKKKIESGTPKLLFYWALFLCTSVAALNFHIQKKYHLNLLIATEQYVGSLQAREDFNQGIRRYYEWTDRAGEKQNTGKTENEFEVWTYPNPVADQETWYFKQHKPMAFVDGYNIGMRRLKNEESQPVDGGQ